MNIQWPFPVVTADNIFTVLTEKGIYKWPRIEPNPVPLDEYLKRPLTEDQQKELEYAPQIEVVLLRDPKKSVYASFRTRGKNGTSVFVLLPPDDLVVIAAEFKGGLEEISLLPPGGQIKKGETPEETAKREFENETGICLQKVQCLLTAGGGPNFRQMFLLDYPLLGIPTDPVSFQSQRLGKREFVEVLLMPLREWLKFIEVKTETPMELHSMAVTYLALRKLGRLKLI